MQHQSIATRESEFPGSQGGPKLKRVGDYPEMALVGFPYQELFAVGHDPVQAAVICGEQFASGVAQTGLAQPVELRLHG